MQQIIKALSLLLLVACSTQPQPMYYGIDACVFCKMTIVDRQHAAQLVTVKGKAYKYDAIECMMNDLKRWDLPDIAHYLVTDYSNPGVLTNAITADFLISEEIPSPMGEFLTAFEKMPNTYQGVSYDWISLKDEFEVR
jgi:copper chaperone NosL